MGARCCWLRMLLAVSLVVAPHVPVFAQGSHTVTVKKQWILKNDAIDNPNEELDSTTAQATTLLGSNVVVRSCTFYPPRWRQFLDFGFTSSTYVDVKATAPGLPTVRIKDSKSEIQVQSTFVAATAGDFPLLVEGNIQGGETGAAPGGSGPPVMTGSRDPREHWSAKVKNEIGNSLTLMDVNGGANVADFDNDDPPPPETLRCSIAADKQGDVQFHLYAEAGGTYNWAIRDSDDQIVKGGAATGALTVSPQDATNYQGSCEDLPMSADVYTLSVTKAGDDDFTREIPFVVTSPVKLAAAPKVIAATSAGDYPVYFEFTNLPKVTITSVTLKTIVNDGDPRTETMTGNARLKGGDAVRGLGNALTNGNTHAYTTFVPKSAFSDIELGTDTKYFRSNNTRIKIIVVFADADEPDDLFTEESEWVGVHGLLDRSIDVCHLGVRYSNDTATYPTALPALNPAGNPPSIAARRQAVPYTRLLKRGGVANYRWAAWTRVFGANPEWRWHEEATETKTIMERPPLDGGVEDEDEGSWRCWGVQSMAAYDYSIGVRVDTDALDDKTGFDLQDEDQWMEMMSGRQDGSLFVWFWGVKNVTPLGGGDDPLTVVDIRKRVTSEATVGLYPGAEVKMSVTDIESPAAWDGGACVNRALGVSAASLTIATTYVTVAATLGPPGWLAIAAYALAGVTIAVLGGREIANVWGGIHHAAAGAEGGEVNAFGAVTISDPDGTSLDGERWGQKASGLGGPGHADSTWRGEEDGDGASEWLSAYVQYQRGATALQTWRIMHSFTASAWAQDQKSDGHAMARLAFKFDNEATNPNAKRCKVHSAAPQPVGDPVGEYVGEGVVHEE
jgi:hypothetical protein